jgi:hypothetical protein
VDSINLDLPDIKDSSVDPTNSRVTVVGSGAPPRGSGSGKGSMRQEWESFMSGSKIDQVKDVWSASRAGAGGDDGAPRATRKQLEEMTARVRAAESGAYRWGASVCVRVCLGSGGWRVAWVGRMRQRGKGELHFPLEKGKCQVTRQE